MGYPPEIVSGSRKSKLTPPDEIRYVCVVVVVCFHPKIKYFHSAFDLIFVVLLVKVPYLQSEVVTLGHANTSGIVGALIKWILFLVRSPLPSRKTNNKTESSLLRCHHSRLLSDLRRKPMKDLYIYLIIIFKENTQQKTHTHHTHAHQHNMITRSDVQTFHHKNTL